MDGGHAHGAEHAHARPAPENHGPIDRAPNVRLPAGSLVLARLLGSEPVVQPARRRSRNLSAMVSTIGLSAHRP